MNVIQEIKDLKRRFNFLRRQYEQYEEPQHETKRYKALITQTGTNAPTAVILENTLGEVPVFSYDDVGEYTITFANTYETNKYIVIFGDAFSSIPDKTELVSAKELHIVTIDDVGDPANAQLTSAVLIIEVYP